MQRGVVRGLDVIGGRWAPQVVRELLLGPGGSAARSPGCPGRPELVSQRLRERAAAGMFHLPRGRRSGVGRGPSSGRQVESLQEPRTIAVPPGIALQPVGDPCTTTGAPGFSAATRWRTAESSADITH